MTPLLVFWLKILIIGLMLHTVWGIIRSVRNRKKIIPSNKKEWTDVLSSAAYLLIAIFLFNMVQRNFQQPITAILKYQGKPIKQLVFNNLTTHQRDELGNYKGKIVILNIWATWCGPCRRELPDLNKIQTDFRNNNTIVLALSDEDESTVEKYIQQFPAQLIYGTYRAHPLLDSLGTRPISILIDKDGNVSNVVTGARGYAFFSDWVQSNSGK
jgi:cytochrome c biogenesis protein CcmG, thiol:disulfide interchange protein DsbE